MKKLLALSFCAAAFVGLTATTAFAGEVTGNPDGGYKGSGQPRATLNGHASECAFSGLNDDRALPGTSQTQNYGHRFDDPFFLDFVSNSRGASALLITIDVPGTPTVPLGCNKHAADILAP